MSQKDGKNKYTAQAMVWLTKKWEASRILGGAGRFEVTNRLMQETDLLCAAVTTTEALLTPHAHSKHSYHFKMLPTRCAHIQKDTKHSSSFQKLVAKVADPCPCLAVQQCQCKRGLAFKVKLFQLYTLGNNPSLMP